MIHEMWFTLRSQSYFISFARYFLFAEITGKKPVCGRWVHFNRWLSLRSGFSFTGTVFFTLHVKPPYPFMDPDSAGKLIRLVEEDVPVPCCLLSLERNISGNMDNAKYYVWWIATQNTSLTRQDDPGPSGLTWEVGFSQSADTVLPILFATKNSLLHLAWSCLKECFHPTCVLGNGMQYKDCAGVYSGKQGYGQGYGDEQE